MHLKPANIKELSNLLACAVERSEKISSVDLSRLNRVLEHKAEDMTATVETGATLVAFQNELRQRGQWLPVDPPNAAVLTIADLLAQNLSGPRRFGYGTVGDYLIGMKGVLADGRVIAPGGKVVKNVAGYDLAKLFIGGHGTIGIIVEATFKLRPVPEKEEFLEKQCGSLDEAALLISAVLDSDLVPIVFDLHNISIGNSHVIVLGFAGTKEEVAWQSAKAKELGINRPATLSYEEEFWRNPAPVQKTSIRPSKTPEALTTLKGSPFVARAGNGVIYHRGAASSKKADLPVKLFERLKNEFDPKHILPEFPL